MPIEKSPVPLYFQISSDIREKIELGELPPGTRLPGEKQLAADYGVSSITARGAMRVLLDEQLIERHPGKGTFVTARRPGRATWGLGSMEDIVMTSLQSDLRVLSAHWTPPPAWVAEAMAAELRPSDRKVYHVRVVRARGGAGFMLTDAYYPPAIGARLRKSDFTSLLPRTKLLIEVVEQRCELRVRDVQQSMSAELADAEAASALGVPQGTPLLTVVRENFTADRRLVQLARSRYRTDTHRYIINVSRYDNAPHARRWS